MHSFNKSLTILKRLSRNNSNEIVTLVENSLPQGEQLGLLSTNVFLKNLRAVARIGSINRSEMPIFELEDSESIRMAKLLESEWNNPRKQLNLYLSIQPNQWELIGAISIVSYVGQQSRSFNLMDILTDNLTFEIGYQTKLGVSSPDVGYGSLQFDDSIVLSGSYVQELTYSSESTFDERMATEVTSIEATIDNSYQFSVLSSNLRRKYVLLFNAGSSPAYLCFDNQPTWGRGIKILPGGHYEFSTREFSWYGAMTAITEPSEDIRETIFTGIEAN